MPVTVRCRACDHTLRVADQHRGKTVACPACGSRLRLPRLLAPPSTGDPRTEGAPRRQRASKPSVKRAEPSSRMVVSKPVKVERVPPGPVPRNSAWRFVVPVILLAATLGFGVLIGAVLFRGENDNRSLVESSDATTDLTGETIDQTAENSSRGEESGEAETGPGDDSPVDAAASDGQDAADRAADRPAEPTLVQNSNQAGTAEEGYSVAETREDPDGYVITAAHVVEGFDEVMVTYDRPEEEVEEGRAKQGRARARVLLSDAALDLALLKMNIRGPLPYVQFSSDARPETGEEVTVIGNPALGPEILTKTMTTGIVSNPVRDFEGYQFIQTNSAVNPGNSGGPMFNSRGEVIGVISMKGLIEGAGFAVPTDVVRGFVSRAWTNESPEADATD